MNTQNLKDQRLAEATRSVELNRQQVADSVDELNFRMQQAIHNRTERMTQLILAPLEFVRRYPLATAGAIVAIGTLIAIRLRRVESQTVSNPDTLLKNLQSAYLP